MSMTAQLEYLAQQCVREFQKARGPIPLRDEDLYKK